MTSSLQTALRGSRHGCWYRPAIISRLSWQSQQCPFSTRPADASSNEMPRHKPTRASRAAVNLKFDMGILPGTFITPSLLNRPNPITSPRAFLRLHWLHLKARITTRAALLAQKLTSPAGARWWQRQMPIERRAVAPAAQRLYVQMYEALARGEADVIRTICCAGLQSVFLEQIARRPKAQKVRWELVRWNRRPRLISDTMVRLENKDGSCLRQSVVKVSTRQRLSKYLDGQEESADVVEKDVVEHLVVQREYKLWKGQQWTVWGTAEETTLENYDRTVEAFASLQDVAARRRLPT